MRPRLRTDWNRDLNERHALETDVANAIANHAGYTLEHNNTASLNDCDYHARDDRGRLLTIELKTRRQNYSTGWCTLRPETRPADLFIIDELAVRKLINRAPHAYLLIADLTAPVVRWVIFSVGDLLVIDRTRVTRPLTTTRGATVSKGKWLIDLGDAPISGDLVVEHGGSGTRRVIQRSHDGGPLGLLPAQPCRQRWPPTRSVLLPR